MVELDKIDLAEGGRDMPPPDAPGPIIPTSAPDEETRAAAETLEVLQRQQPSVGLPKGSSLLTSPGEADYFKVHDPGSRNCAVFVLYTVSIVLSFTSRV